MEEESMGFIRRFLWQFRRWFLRLRASRRLLKTILTNCETIENGEKRLLSKLVKRVVWRLLLVENDSFWEPRTKLKEKLSIRQYKELLERLLFEL